MTESRRADTALDIAGLVVAYGATVALQGIDLRVARGEFVALLGPSGCGKTSLLRAIAGFVHPRDGAIHLNGHEVSNIPPRERNIGLVFQSYALFPHMTALENVRFGLDCRNVPKQAGADRAARALSLVGLSEHAARRPRELSGGQQQRVALARAIVIEPHLLLLDEPLGALDKQLRLQMQDELKQLQRRLGITSLFVTHDHEEAMSMADRVVVMRDGQIEQGDAPEQIILNPATAWIADFMRAGNILHGATTCGSTGLLQLEIAPGVTFEAPAPPQYHASWKLFVPFDAIRLEPATDEQGMTITAHRYLGLSVELRLTCDGGAIGTQMTLAEAAAFPIGTRARVIADPARCRFLPQ